MCMYNVGIKNNLLVSIHFVDENWHLKAKQNEWMLHVKLIGWPVLFTLLVFTGLGDELMGVPLLKMAPFLVDLVLHNANPQ